MFESTVADLTSMDNALSIPPQANDVTTAPRMCCYCSEPLASTDKAKSTGRSWKGYKKCRDKRTAKEQKRRRLRTSTDVATDPNISENKTKKARNPLEMASDLFKRAKAESELHSGDEQDDEETFTIKREPLSAADPSSLCKYNTEDTSDGSNSETTECTVCALTSLTRTFPVLPSCSHPPSICCACLTQWLTTQILTLQPIPCPSTDCPTFLSHSDIHTHVPLPLFTRYDDLIIRSLLSSDPSFLYCLRPSCHSGQIHDSGTAGPIFRCAECGFRMCTAHEPVVTFHEDETCAAYVERVERERKEREARQEEDEMIRREEEEASREAVNREAVECPGCGVMIHKMGGCDHITCKFA
ncbi:hypothetical protein HRS9122_03339 [Pyrenophora teres f. teres]|nr:hypothetical protein HRS9122_03339 [Pyrenophora teres f. teres]